MGHLFGRVVWLKNETDRVIELKESRRFAPHGLYSYTIRLDRFQQKKIGATMFHRRTQTSSKTDSVEDEKVIVRGVRATRSDQFRRTRLVGSLISGLCFLIGNDEHGGQGEDIV
ncbi:hypothetical protein Pint_12729 [Pistacia integerrima]|uniref:Uncharacterized protein n=1 Tax=Pistacia integerrima TaxID=434235 RepID=A0ACC0Y4T0_9ROSI|nr:hypothetical protein Pint_12729 [Pistacia integerrima]